MVQFVTLPNLSDYQETMILMENRVGRVIEKASPEIVYLVEHKSVYTAGTGFKAAEHIDVPVIYTGRGGKLTYHGEGQRVIYPILNLSANGRQKDLRLYIKMLEEWMVKSLSHFGIKAFTIDNMVGIWVEEDGVPAKIASIGVRVKKWVTYHGIAINVSTNLDMFSGIIPCGLKNAQITSLQKLGINITFSEFDPVIQKEFSLLFG